ncbi:MAG: TraX family protein [Prevotella sp.]|nr:TraX family protein [Prevotella sp.]
MKGILNRNQIKYIAIIAMIIDHIAWTFVPITSVLGQVMHVIGRLTGPTMAFMIAEGYVHTRDVKKYAVRLGIFALISWPPFSLFENGVWPSLSLSVIYPLFLGLIAVWMWDKSEASKGSKIAALVGLCILSIVGDWAFMDVLWVFFFYIYRDRPKAKWIAFSIVALFEVGFSQLMSITTGHPFRQAFQWGVFLVIPILSYCYNGEPGSKKPFHKWFFYIFYPGHLLILYILKCIFLK